MKRVSNHIRFILSTCLRSGRQYLPITFLYIHFFTTAVSSNSDLAAYTSPSTGTDGSLVIPDSLPTWAETSFTIQLAYDESNGYLMAMGRESETPLLNGTYGLYSQENGEWTKQNSTRWLSETTITYDGARDEVVRFGGITTNIDTYQTGMYAWDGGNWVLKPATDNIRPSSRSFSSMAFDSAREEVVLFGGQNNGGLTTDTWVWNGTSWTDKTPGTSPPARVRGAMAFDAARGEVVLFGGWFKNDTWTWNGTTWTEESPTNVPPSRLSSAMAYDPNRQVVVLGLPGTNGNFETWEWNGSDWTQKAVTSDPGERNYHGLVYSPETSTVQLHSGDYRVGTDRNSDSWSWDGSNWSLLTVSPFIFDMTAKPSGIWHYTTIYVGQTEVRFINNDGKTPLIWLATGDVNINGHLNLNGSQGYFWQDPQIHTPAPGGPGGFDGGLGGFYEPATGGNTTGFPGIGPGGGAASPPGGIPGDRDGFHATHYELYNNSSLQAISGGSGGGGTATTFFSESNEWGRGGNGGGGGGAVLIASSRDIWVNGKITAMGGEGGFETYKRPNQNPQTTFPRGGSGSGGSIRLVADRVFVSSASSFDVSATINNSHDRDDVPENKGRIRIEAVYHDITWAAAFGNEHYSVTEPKTTLFEPNIPTLEINSIAGQNVSINPSSDPAAPEVTFSSAGPVTIVVSAENVPDGSAISLRVTSGSAIVTATPQTLTGGAANFSVTVPAGSGVVQAWTDWEVTP